MNFSRSYANSGSSDGETQAVLLSASQFTSSPELLLASLMYKLLCYVCTPKVPRFRRDCTVSELKHTKLPQHALQTMQAFGFTRAASSP